MVSWAVTTGRSENCQGDALAWYHWLHDRLPGGWRQSGQKHYEHGFRLEDWGAGVYWGGRGDAAGTWLLEVRQAALGLLTPADHRRLLAAGRPRRIDLALDDVYERCRPRDLFHAAREARARSRKDRWRLDMTNFGALTTLYVGSRSSAAMLRVYDKPPVGVRHELELKDYRAEKAGERLLRGWPVEAVFRLEYSRVAQWPTVPGWVALGLSYAA